MDTQDPRNLKIDMDSLKSSFKKKSPEDCPMADSTMAYALGDLDPAKENKVRNHIQSCPHCLDLFLDTRAAESDSQDFKGKKAKILPGLKKALEPKGGSIGSKIQNILVDTFKNIFTGTLLPKHLAVAAACCLVLIISIFGIWDMTKTQHITIEMALTGRSITGYIDGLRGKEPQYEISRVENGGTLKSGDSFRIKVNIDRDGFVYLIYYNSTGDISGFKKGYVKAGEELVIPDEKNWYELDKNIGTETIFLIASSHDIKQFDNKIMELKERSVDLIKELFPKASIQEFRFRHE